MWTRRWCVIVCLLLLAAPAAADKHKRKRVTWPTRWVDQPLLVPRDMVRVAGDTLGISLTRRAAGEPIFIAPDLYVGYRPDLTLALLHDRGICVAAPCKGYSDVRVAALYHLATGPYLGLAAIGAIAVPSTHDPFGAGLRGGLALRVHTRDVGVVFTPEMYLGVIGRDRVADRLMLPFTVGWQHSDELTALLTFAWQGPLSNFSDTVEIPVGVGINYRVAKHIDLGAEFRFDNLFGRGATWDRRTLLLRLAIWYQGR